jgi:ubiquinone/menaquinone biosynthesis C-methylase UbiE
VTPPEANEAQADANSGTDRYPLGHSDAETRRLILQHQVYAPLTRRFLVDAGITAGMRVLDVGSGAGDVALMLAELVGPQGRVVGVDANPAILDVARRRADAAGWRNVTFHPADLQRPEGLDGLDGRATQAPFDAVVGRWVLMFLPDPAALLRTLRAHLSPGGIVAFQESDLTNPVRSYPPAPLHERLAELTPPPDTALPDRETGLKLFRTFVDAGLPAPRLNVGAPAGGGPDWVGYAYLAATVRSILPFVAEARGLRPDEDEDLDLDTLEDRLRDEIVATGGIQILPTVVGASTRL